jgi:hypothetical protein
VVSKVTNDQQTNKIQRDQRLPLRATITAIFDFVVYVRKNQVFFSQKIKNKWILELSIIKSLDSI